MDVVYAKNGAIRRPNGLKLYGDILALPGIILKIPGAGVENFHWALGGHKTLSYGHGTMWGMRETVAVHLQSTGDVGDRLV